MGEMGDSCYNCHWFVFLAAKKHCLLAKNIIEDDQIAEFCDFYKEDPYESLYDNNAVERTQQKNDQSLPKQE